jgi:TonB-dependent receptor
MAALVIMAAAGHAVAALEADGVVSGRVTDGLTGDPIAGAQIEVAETQGRTEADRKGRFVLSHLPAGRVTLVVSLAGYESERTEVVLDPRVTTTIEIVLTPSLERIMSVRLDLIGDAQQRALNLQRAAPNITTVIAADQLGRLPDGNAADALQRIAGVSTQLERGEGHDVLVRGTAPQLNSVTLNGDRLPSMDSDRRSVELDVFPADLLQTVEVAKTLLPSADGDSIGGSVNLSMREIPRRAAWAMSFGTGRDEFTRDSHQASATASGGGRLLQGRLGLFAAGSGSLANRGVDSVRAMYSGVSPNDVAIRKYQVERQRKGINAAADYQVSDNTTVFLHAVLATYHILENRETLRYQLSPGTVGHELQHDDTHRTIALAFAGGQHLLPRGASVDFRVSLGYGGDSEPRNFNIAFARPLQVVVPPVELAGTPFLGGADASTFTLSTVTSDTLFARDRDVGGAANFTVPAGLGAGSLFKAGVKYRHKLKTRDISGAGGQLDQPATLVDFAGPAPAFMSAIGPAIDSTRVSTLIGTLPFIQDAALSAGNYVAHENLLAAYAMLELPLSARLSVIPGLRHEYSTSRYLGYGFDGTTTWPLSSNGGNGYWLPGVNVRYAASPNTIVRAAFTRSFARPDFADLVPYELRDGEAVSKGNPRLNPTLSWNADIAVERYFRHSGLVSVALFAKKLDGYIYTVETASTLDGQPILLTQPRNGEAATLAGVEVNIQQQLRMLPAPLDGLGVYATYTRTTSSARYPMRPGVGTLPGQTPNLGNVALSYERRGFSGRLAVNFHGEYLNLLGLTEAADQHLAGRTQMDLSIAQHIARHTWVVFDAHNLTDAPNTTFGASLSRPTLIERFGRYETFGVRLVF